MCKESWSDAHRPPSELHYVLKVKAEYTLTTGVIKTRVNVTTRRFPGVELRVPRTKSAPRLIPIDWIPDVWCLDVGMTGGGARAGAG
jgi:hypothetical protein